MDIDIVYAYPYYRYPYYGYGYSPWGWYPYYPYYGYGYGYGYGFGFSFGFAPWFYPAPWGYGGFWYSAAPYYSETEPSGVESAPEPEERIVGAVRIRSNAEKASVYVDGVRVGIVDDFNGLSDHLYLEKGRHTIELKADGFESASVEVNVKVGQTQTVRLNLKR